MRRKVFSMVVGIFLIAVFLAVSSNVSASDVTDLKALIGRWEGSTNGLDSRWTSRYDVEIFAVDTEKKRVMYRWMCPDCTTSPVGYSDRLQLIVEKGKIYLQSPERPGWSGITWELKGDRLSGSATSYRDTGIFRFEYSLKKISDVKRVFEPKELIGEWIRVSGNNWWLLTVTEVDAQSKTFKGKYKIGMDKTEYDFSDAKVIVEGDKLKVDFKTINDTLHYQMTFYPNFGEYPPVLWGKLESMDGNVFYPMFRKKEKKE